MSKVIFGGTFNPVHKGHVEAVKILSGFYDRVYVMPAAKSPFKEKSEVSDADRLAMLRIAFRDLPGVSINRFEIDRGGDSYTANTLRVFPDCDFAVGADSMKTLATWTKADEIRARTRIAVIGRGSVNCDNAVRDWIEGGGKVIRLGKVPNVSSEKARLQMSLDRTSALVPHEVGTYIMRRNLYHDWDDVKELFRETHLKVTRIRHTYRVAYAAFDLAERYGADKNVCVRAALLHDIAKYMTPDEVRAYGVELDPSADRLQEGVRHAVLGAAFAQQHLREPPEIVDAIRWHTTGRPGMSLIEKIVCLADYIEPGREFRGVEEVRSLAKWNLDRAMCAMLANTLAYLGTDRNIDATTKEAYEYYQKVISK